MGEGDQSSGRSDALFGGGSLEKGGSGSVAVEAVGFGTYISHAVTRGVVESSDIIAAA